MRIGEPRLDAALCGITQVIAVIVALSAIHPASALPIVNPGFESPSTASFVSGAATGWTISGSGGGVWNINTSPLGFWTASAPEGSQVGWLSPAIGPGSPASFSQLLGDTLQANTLYTLAGFVGHPTGFGTTPTPDTTFTVELLAGANVLASVTGTGPEGTLAPFSLPFDSSGSPYVGLTLQIRLSSSKAQTAYDAISLSAVAVPEPSSVLLSGMGAVLLALWRRRARAI